MPTNGNDVIIGTSASETIDAMAGDDIVRAGLGDDRVYGRAGWDEIYGEDGKDRIWGGDGDDVLDGGLGNDQLFGEADDDELYGGGSGDLLRGGEGDDVLAGERGNDTLFGDAGADALAGNEGSDVLWGGTGSDIFSYGIWLLDGARGGSNIMTVGDFTRGSDRLELGVQTEHDFVTWGVDRFDTNRDGWLGAGDRGVAVRAVTLDGATRDSLVLDLEATRIAQFDLFSPGAHVLTVFGHTRLGAADLVPTGQW